jgi:beta-glucosidase
MDISMGFTYMYLASEPLFAFGHGLSYTEFRYSKLRLSADQIPPDGIVTVAVDVENTGRRAGDEVVQLYVRDADCSVNRPTKELRGFERINFHPGEKKTVTFFLPADKLSFYDEQKHAFVVEPGAFDTLSVCGRVWGHSRGERGNLGTSDANRPSPSTGIHL